MQALEFWKTVTVDKADFLENLVGFLAERRICYCVVGGVAANAYCEPVVTLDLDIVIAAEQMDEIAGILSERYRWKRFPHSLNLEMPGSNLRVQIQTDAEYSDFPGRAVMREVLGLTLPVAAIGDVLQGKIWAVMDPEQRASKRLKDLADIQRLIEAHPQLRGRVPPEVQRRLFKPGDSV